jgi:hypothetical protein
MHARRQADPPAKVELTVEAPEALLAWLDARLRQPVRTGPGQR